MGGSSWRERVVEIPPKSFVLEEVVAIALEPAVVLEPPLALVRSEEFARSRGNRWCSSGKLAVEVDEIGFEFRRKCDRGK